ncbi:MAG: hypothetical protein U0790_07865 [Isosphaeraceae bacterium]
MLTAFAAVPAAKEGQQASDAERIRFLESTARRLLEGCRVRARDGTTLYTPDGRGNYRALWTRDFAYMVENAGDLIPTDDVEACLRYLLRGQRDDGAIPDRVDPEGLPIYVAGSPEHPLGRANLDNPGFLVIAVDEYLKRLPRGRAERLFREWSASLDRAMDWVPRSQRGLVFNDPADPHSPYGFTDTVGKTGELFFESLLDWTACGRLAAWHDHAGKADRAEAYRARRRKIERNLEVLWDEPRGAFLAATHDCRQIDVWGNAYAIDLGIPLPGRRDRVLRFLVDRRDQFLWRGQVRHLLKGETWQRQLAPVPPGRYQNGAYWATASGWVINALSCIDPQLARRVFRELIADFLAQGVHECIAEYHRQLESYVVSAANPLGTVRKLGWP